MDRVVVSVSLSADEIRQIELVREFYGLSTRSAVLRYLLHAEAKKVTKAAMGPGASKCGRPRKTRRPEGC